MSSSLKGKLLCEGKTKQIYQHASNPNLVLIESKDRITAGDGVKAHEMKDKSEFSTRTNAAIFEYLNAVGVPTSFVSRVEGSSQAFIAKSCTMIPIEWVTRRIATGSFLKRNPNVKEGYRFAPVKLETFYKDDANHDPQWSIESLKEATFPDIGKLQPCEVEQMCMLTRLVFQLLERAWQTHAHSLVDMKIEFGKDKETGAIVLSDVIDNDSWRLWPNGDKRLMLDKQVYRNLAQVDEESMAKIRSNFALVAERTENLFRSLVPTTTTTQPSQGQDAIRPPQVGIIMGSSSDRKFVDSILASLGKFGVRNVEVHVSSAHKSTEYTLEVIERLNQWPTCKCIIAVAGRSNGLGLVAAANSTIPVINCPPMSDLSAAQVDIWSSLRVPSGLGCVTALGADCAAMAAAHIMGNDDPFIWSKIKTAQTIAAVKLIEQDGADSDTSKSS